MLLTLSWLFFCFVFFWGWGVHASVPEDLEQSSTNAAPAFPTAAPPDAWSGAELRVNGGNGGIGDPSVILHTAFLSQAGNLGTKRLHGFGKRHPLPRRGLEGKEWTCGSRPSPGV